MTDEQTLRDELDEIDRRIRDLRGARHLLTVDLEWAEKEADRLRRHLTASYEDKRGD